MEERNMNEEILKKYRKAGKIAKKAREFGKKLINPGESYLDVVNKTENKIKELGGEPAFPVNLSANEIGAHDTADINDKRKIKKGDLVKLDVGVHLDGYIADTALTVSLNSGKEKMIKAVEEALEKVLGKMKPNTKIKEISSIIESTIRKKEYNPVVNLTGHGLERYNLHAKVEIPNIKTDKDYSLKKGDVFAIEPFATDGRGKVKESNRTLIYRYLENKNIRLREGKKILDFAKKERMKLPFSRRWLKNEIGTLKLKMALKQLSQKNALYKYPVLKEIEGGDIAQAEHSVIVKEKPEVITI